MILGWVLLLIRKCCCGETCQMTLKPDHSVQRPNITWLNLKKPVNNKTKSHENRILILPIFYLLNHSTCTWPDTYGARPSTDTGMTTTLYTIFPNFLVQTPPPPYHIMGCCLEQGSNPIWHWLNTLGPQQQKVPAFLQETFWQPMVVFYSNLTETGSSDDPVSNK